LLIRLLTVLTLLAPAAFTLTACGPSYSPDTYATNAAQQANKVEAGVIAGVRPVKISAQGAVGGVSGAAAGGIAGSQVGAGPTSAFAAIGGSVVGGLAGVAGEHLISDTNGFEYVVRKVNGDMVSVVQKDTKPLEVGQKVLVIAGPQARIVPDYTVPFDAPAKTAAKSGTQTPAPTTDAHPAADGAAPHPAVTVTSPVPADTAVPPQLPTAFASPATTPPPVITPSEVPAKLPATSTTKFPPVP